MDTLLACMKVRKIKIPRQFIAIIAIAFKLDYFIPDIKYNKYLIIALKYLYDYENNYTAVANCAIINDDMSLLKIVLKVYPACVIENILCAIEEKNIKALMYINMLNWDITYIIKNNDKLDIISKIIIKNIKYESVKDFVKKYIVFDGWKKENYIKDVFKVIIMQDNIEWYDYYMNFDNAPYKYIFKTAIIYGNINILNLLMKSDKDVIAPHINRFLLLAKNKKIIKLLYNNSEDLNINNYITVCVKTNYIKGLDIVLKNESQNITTAICTAIDEKNKGIYYYIINKYRPNLKESENQKIFEKLCEKKMFDIAKSYIYKVDIYKSFVYSNKFYDMFEDKNLLFKNAYYKINHIKQYSDEKSINYIIDNELLCSYEFITYVKDLDRFFNIYKESELINNAVIEYITNYNSGFERIYNIIISHKYIDLDEIIDVIISKNLYLLLEFLISKGIKINDKYKYKYLTNDIETFKVLYNNGYIILRKFLMHSIDNNNQKMFELILFLETFDYTNLIIFTLRRGKHKMAKYIIKNFKYDKDLIKVEIYEGRRKLFKYI